MQHPLSDDDDVEEETERDYKLCSNNVRIYNFIIYYCSCSCSKGHNLQKVHIHGLD